MASIGHGWIIMLSMMVICATVPASGAFPATEPAEIVVRIGGTGSALGTMKQLAELYEKSHPGTRIAILPSLGSTAGIKAVLGGGIDLALASRPLTESERLQGAVETEYARSPFVFVTNAKVKKKNITIRELEAIYSNPAATWADGSRIRLILRPETDIDTKLVRSLSPGMEQGVKAALARPGMIMAITDQEAADAVDRTPGALGGGTLTEIISENRPVNILALNGVQPNVKSIADNSYPLVKFFYLVTTPKSTAEARKFAEFVRSPGAGRILAKSGNLIVRTK
jgi:phosphate transport system substrate-binding protein